MRVASPPQNPGSTRVVGIDVARGVASLIMIQGHAYHAWASPEAKETAAYAFTRLLGTLPLPAFLLLAGAAVTLRVESAVRRAENARDVRRQIMRRGLTVVGWGYLTNVAYALMDGWEGIETFLRADVLHVIGLGIITTAFLGIRARRGEEGCDLRHLWRSALIFGVALTAFTPWLYSLGASTPASVAPWLGLFFDVPPYTLMPLFPLGSWMCLGVLLASMMRAARERGPGGTVAGAPTAWLWVLAVACVVVALGSSTALDAIVAQSGEPLTRGHAAIGLNVTDLGARGGLVLAASALLSLVLPQRLRTLLVHIGQGSLYAYIFHIPFCYGVLGAPFQARLTMAEASLGVVLLSIASIAAVYAQRAWTRRRLRQTDR